MVTADKGCATVVEDSQANSTKLINMLSDPATYKHAAKDTIGTLTGHVNGLPYP